tara:strand:+ start:378 stop:710 length:333 start_codon:yes stop_codon:yes gene_type:complete
MSEEYIPSFEFMSMNQGEQVSQESWVDDPTLLTEGAHSVKIVQDGRISSRDVSVKRSLDSLEVRYTTGDYEVVHSIKPNGLTYTTKSYMGPEPGIPRTTASKGMWRYYGR